MSDPFEALTPELLVPVVVPGGDAGEVAAHIRVYLEARAALRALPLGPRANALVHPAGGLK
jgi:hypothetical protein